MNASAPWADHTVIYGGSFDPPHMGHQMACLALLEGLGCPEVWLVPAYTHPLDKALSAFAHRLAMCQRLAAPFADRVHVSAAERELGGAGRTFDLITALKAAHPGRLWALAIGADIVGQTHLWHRWQAIEALVPIIIIGRSGYPEPGHTPCLPDIASSRLRQMLRHGQSVAGQMPQSVLGYVHAHELYAPSKI